ncbi:hypothetical protein AAG570_010602 [Ranatra chinensis]|uniref:Serpin domain-containing protein n=1 Tax=Ranatra chinensis TaxID=642074 RepID=A0ABD0YN07_9HEMI
MPSSAGLLGSQFMDVLIVVTQSDCRQLDEESFVKTDLSEAGRLVSDGVKRFGIDVFKVMCSESRKNLIFSPFSISLGVGMLYMMTAGRSADEITKALYLQSDSQEIAEGFNDMMQSAKRSHPLVTLPDGEYRKKGHYSTRRSRDERLLSRRGGFKGWVEEDSEDTRGLGSMRLSRNGSVEIGNRAYVDDRFTLKQSYLDTIQNYLEADSENVDFSDPENARQIINQWVSNKTKGKVPTLFQPGTIDLSTKIALVNTLYFKGLWHYPFNNALSMERDFHTEDGQVKKVNMMSITKSFRFAEIPKLELKAISLPYENGRQKMLIILPDKPDGLVKLEQTLTLDNIQNEILNVMGYEMVKVRIPKFNLDESISLKNTLIKMGVVSVFDANKANFSRGVDVDGLEVSAVQHRACIEVDAKGTVGAAATGIAISLRSGLMVSPSFIADHPFIFVITDVGKKAILFMGRYMGPP